jgi:hypothetical protein
MKIEVIRTLSYILLPTTDWQQDLVVNKFMTIERLTITKNAYIFSHLAGKNNYILV